MLVAHLIPEVEKLGASITLDDAGENLVIEPGSVLTPELIGELRRHKPYLVRRLTRREECRQDTSPPVANIGEVLEIAREVLPELKEEDRVDLDELIQANSPPEPGRDPLAKHGTDKAHFFHAPADCTCNVCFSEPKYARRKDGKTFEGGRS